MKKHFLLLFLMALLPLVGWAQPTPTATTATWDTGGAGIVGEFQYDGTQPVLQNHLTVRRNNQTLRYQANLTSANRYNYTVHSTEAGASAETAYDQVTSWSEAGTYYVRINWRGNYSTGHITTSFEIKKAKVIINAAYTYKTYGQEDPTSPLFEFDASNPTPVAKDDIKDYLVLKRVTGEVGEDVGSYLYYIDFVEDYAQTCPYDIAILQNNSNLVIQKADLHVKVIKNWKEFNTEDPAFDYTIVSGLQWDDTKDDVNATITRPNARVTDPVNAKLDSHGEPQPLAGGETYEFAGEAANYKIIFDNKFYVVPSTNVDNIKVIVKNYSVPEGDSHFDTDEFVYRGTEYTPGRGQEEKDNLIVTDGTYNLVNGKDYTVDGYVENVHVGQATVTINFVGSDSYATTKKKSANFNIVKATLTITANTYSGVVPGEEPATFGWKYAGWVNGEGTEDAPGTNPKPKDFQAPSGVTKQAVQGSTDYKLIVNHDAKAADYDIKYVDGDLIYGNTAVIVTATNTGKTYGEPDPKKLPYTVLHEDDTPLTDAEWAAIGGKDHPYFTIFRAEGENVGEYAITFDGPTVLPEGIKITYHDGTFTIGHKTVWLKGDDTSKIYGDANPTFDATVYETRTGNAPNYSYSNPWDADKKAEEGVINPDFYYVGVEDAYWNGREWVLASENVTPGNDYYAVTPTVRGNGITKSGRGNYRVVVSGVGKFTITPAPLTIQADDKVKMYGQPDPEFTATVTGLKRNDRVVKGVDYQVYRSNPNFARNNEIGQYTIYVAPTTTPVTAVLKNYAITWTNGTLTIDPMDLLVVADEQAVNYGDPIDPYKAQVYFIVGEKQYQPSGWNANDIAKVFSLEADVTKVGATKDAYTLVDANNTNYNLKEFTNNWLTVNPLKTIPLDENALAEITEQPLKKVLDDHKGLTLDVTLPARGMKADNWYSWVLPFQVKQEDFFKTGVWGYGAMEVLDVNKTTDKSVSFSLTVMKPIEANTPFIVKINNDIDKATMSTITFKNVTIADFDYMDKTPTAGDADQVQFIGVYEETLMGEGSRWLVRYSETDENEFWPGKGNTLKRTNAYLQFPTENAAREAKIFIEDQNGGTTEITGVKAEANGMNAEGWYNLNGVKMEGAPSRKGVYIKDGKKVVIK